MTDVISIRILADRFEALDQTLLPHEERLLPLETMETVCEAISSLRVRGAPLLGIVGAAGLAVAAGELGTSDEALRAGAARIIATRPTAVDLSARTNEALAVALAMPVMHREKALWEFARRLHLERVDEDYQIARAGAALLPKGSRVLTHCNTGALATGGIGTALGVIRLAWEAGQLTRCFATETRPLLQGARLTAWELKRLGIPASLLPDTAAALLLASGHVTAVVTGADRIAANGDTANKVGTYGLAAVAARHGVPFYIAAPTSTVDLACPDGHSIPIEFRDGGEVGGFAGQRWSPEGMDAYNPAFDVTPAELITGIVTERGVATAPFAESLRQIAARRVTA